MVDARLGYRNKADPPGQWTEYAKSFEARNLRCDIDEDKQGSDSLTKKVDVF